MTTSPMWVRTTPEKTSAALCIYGNDLDINYMTRLLGVKPTDMHPPNWEVNSGMLAELFGAHVIPSGYWSISSENFLTSLDVQDHISWALSIIEKKEGEILSMISSRKITLKMYVLWMTSRSDGGFSLSKSLIHRLANFEMSLESTVVFYGID